MQSYSIWNNKGGTGKSTITFHVASRFAEKHPDRKVLVVDLCPQANSSMLLLGGGVSGEKELLKLCSQSSPKSVVGYISDAILKRTTPKLSDYSIQVSAVNERIPDNLHLLCGDGNLELMAPAIIDEANRTPFPGLADPWEWVHLIFERMTNELDKEAWTVFFDTNPSFSIYTELAICGSTRILVPVNADDSSRVAVKALFALLYGTNPPHPFFGNYTFAAKANLRKISIPQVHLAIGNRFTQFKGAAAAFQAFSDATADQLWSEFNSNPNRFTTRNKKPKNREKFLSMYVGELRDFNTAGVVAAHHGTPMSKMRQDYYSVHNDPEVKVNKSQLTQGLDAVDSVVDRIDP
ncbi:ParA family protein [Arenibacterium sp. LLYu02]|uniref:ParA family protein n=1 Tax=Arenibacterium sp. LLYu02 TaxID=3404132 RepID=UPI003B211961